MVWLAKWFMPANRKMSAKSSRPRRAMGAIADVWVWDCERDNVAVAIGFLLQESWFDQVKVDPVERWGLRNKPLFFRPPGLIYRAVCVSHRLRGGLHSFAALRLCSGQAFAAGRPWAGQRFREFAEAFSVSEWLNSGCPPLPGESARRRRLWRFQPGRRVSDSRRG